MALVAKFDLETLQLDAVNAFVNGILDDPVYIMFPQGFEGDPTMCLQLDRALYGLKESPALWQRELTAVFKALGLKPVPDEPCIVRNDWLTVFFWVDDIVLLCRKEDLEKRDEFVRQLTAKFEMRNEGELHWFLGIRVVRNRAEKLLWLCQDSYIEKIAAKFDLVHARKVRTPMRSGEHSTPPPPSGPSTEISRPSVKRFQYRVGSALYAAIITRPDVAYAVSRLSQSLTNPRDEDQKDIDRVIAYLYQYRYYAVQFDGLQGTCFLAATDAAFADDMRTRHSSQAHLFLLFGGAIGWRASRQQTVTTSSTEAELLALSDAASELLALERLFTSLTLVLNQRLTILCDNQMTIRLVNSLLPRLKTRLRHVDIHSCFLREKVHEGRLLVSWTSTTEMPADGLTKALQQGTFERFRDQLGLVDITDVLADYE